MTRKMNHWLLGVPKGTENFLGCLWCDHLFCNKKKKQQTLLKGWLSGYNWLTFHPWKIVVKIRCTKNQLFLIHCWNLVLDRIRHIICSVCIDAYSSTLLAFRFMSWPCTTPSIRTTMLWLELWNCSSSCLEHPPLNCSMPWPPVGALLRSVYPKMSLPAGAAVAA